MSTSNAWALEIGTEVPSVDTFGLLGVVSVLLIMLLVAVLWWRKKHHLGGQTQGFAKVLGCMSLGIKEKLVLIEVGDKQILIGMTPQNMQTLHVFSEPVMDADAVDEAQQSFLWQLQQAMQQRWRK